MSAGESTLRGFVVIQLFVFFTGVQRIMNIATCLVGVAADIY